MKRILGLVFVFSLSLPLIALAQNDENAGKRPANRGQQSGEQRPRPAFFTEDGKIDLSKLGDSMPAERVEAMKKADKNNDGFLDREEMQETRLIGGMRMGPRGMGGPQSGGMPPFMSEAMTQDGKLDLAKMAKSVKNDKMLENFKKADKNNDGFLDADELKQAMPPQMPGGNFGGPRGMWADAMTEDGKLDLAKLPKGIDKDIQKKLKKADKDKDGILNEEEIKSVASEVPGLGRMGGPGFGPGFGENGPRGNRSTFMLRRMFGDAAVTEDGRLDLSKLPKKMDNTTKRNLKKADKDKDGFLNQEELATQFPQMNRFNRRPDDNGRFGGGDRGNRQGRNGEAQNAKQADSASLLESMGDARMENGSIDLSKLPSSVNSSMRNNMKAADFNKDGVLDSSEQKAIFPQLKK